MNLIEAHPGDADDFKGVAICATTDAAVAKKAVEWLEWADDKIRIAEDLDEVTSRSAKRRKTRIAFTVHEHGQGTFPESATAEAIETATGNVPTLCKIVSDQIRVSVKHVQTPNSSATRSPLGHASTTRLHEVLRKMGSD